MAHLTILSGKLHVYASYPSNLVLFFLDASFCKHLINIISYCPNERAFIPYMYWRD